jgi:hypothetical protein
MVESLKLFWLAELWRNGRVGLLSRLAMTLLVLALAVKISS